MQVPQSSPAAGFEAHRGEIEAAIAGTLNSGWYILGRQVQAFEQEFAAFVGVPGCVGVANGTDAIELALRACDIGPGDAVLAVSHTAVATVAAIQRAGATPVLLDIDPGTFTLDANQMARTLAGESGGLRFKAVVVVHLYGHPANLPAILELSRKRGLRVIEDCAQAHGAMCQGRQVGTWGDLAAYSFYPTKNLGALGDGGAVVTGDAALAERVRALREYGWRERYVSHEVGMNSRLDELQAAILRVKLRHLAADNVRRREIAAQYLQRLAGAAVQLPRIGPEVEHVFHQFVIRTPQRDVLRAHLQSRGIGALIHYPVPVHLQPAYRGRVAPGAGGLPETERAAVGVLSLPMFPQLRDEQVERVVDAVMEWKPDRA
jgi:dTDP-4-amino-4,6-dideoxygalactose transaminase